MSMKYVKVYGHSLHFLIPKNLGSPNVWSAISFKSSKSACTFTKSACTFTIVRALFVKVNCKSARTFELLKLMAHYISAVSFKSPKSVCTFTIVRALYQISVLRFPKYSTNVTTIKMEYNI